MPLHSNAQDSFKLHNIASLGSFIGVHNIYRPVNTNDSGLREVRDTKFACSSGIYSDIDLTRLFG